MSSYSQYAPAVGSSVAPTYVPARASPTGGGPADSTVPSVDRLADVALGFFTAFQDSIGRKSRDPTAPYNVLPEATLLVLGFSRSNDSWEFDCVDSDMGSKISIPCYALGSEQPHPAPFTAKFHGVTVQDDTSGMRVLARLRGAAMTVQRPLRYEDLPPSVYKLPVVNNYIDAAQQSPPAYSDTSTYAPVKDTPRAPLPSAPGIMPIADITCYTQACKIRARIISKEPLKKFTSARGEMQRFFIILKDASGEIVGSFFGSRENALTHIHNTLDVGCVYEVSARSVKPKNEKFNKSSHSCELALDEKADFRPLQDDGSIPTETVTYTPISQIANMPERATVDILGVVVDYRPLGSVTIKVSNTQKQTRDIYIVDPSECGIWLTIWGELTDCLPDRVLETQPVVSISKTAINMWKGRKLNTSRNSSISYNSKNPAAEKLDQWWTSEGSRKVASFQSLSNEGAAPGVNGLGGHGSSLDGMENFKTIANIEDETKLANNDATLLGKGMFFTLRATLDSVNRDRYTYPACPTCRRKLTQDEPGIDKDDHRGTWSCGTCNRQYGECNYQFIAQLTLKDSSGALAVTAFGTSASTLLGIEANALKKLQTQGGCDPAGKSADDYFNDSCHKDYVFKLRARKESYNDDTKVKYSLFQATPANGANAAAETERKMNVVKNTINSDWR